MRAKETAYIRGLAWDGGYRIRGVDISTDGGTTWRGAALEQTSAALPFAAFALRSPRGGPGHIR